MKTNFYSIINKGGEEMRKRFRLKEVYNLDVNEIYKLILSLANSYENVEGYSKELALEISMSDYSFWYNDSDIRLKELEKLFAIENIKHEMER